MLLLLLKGYWWAAWWPYSTWFLAVDKALCRMNQGCEPPQYQTNDEGQVSIRESAMANATLQKTKSKKTLMLKGSKRVGYRRTKPETKRNIAR